MGTTIGVSNDGQLLRRRAAKFVGMVERWRFTRAYLRAGTAPSIESLPYLRTISPNLIVDVGANRGQFSLAARECHPDAHIVAFEPLRAPARRYARLFAGDRFVTFHRFALSTDRGNADMHVARDDDSSSLLKFSESHTENFAGIEEVGRETVRTAPLTDFIGEDDLKGANLLKIDVQGAELSVLKSAAPLLKRFDWICVEASFLPFYCGQPLANEVISFLEQHEFMLSGMFNVTFAPHSDLVVQSDFSFRNIKRREPEAPDGHAGK
jgi:FkbM family methyltransferase